MPFNIHKKKKKKSADSRQRRRGGRTVSKRNRIILGIAVVLAAVTISIFLFFIRSSTDVSLAENAAGTVISPIQSAFTNATNYVINLINNGRNYSELKVQYDALMRENESLKLEIASYEEESAENQRLSSLLGAYDRYTSLDPIYGQVIARDPGIWFDTFSINAGTNQGIAVNMAVVNGDGLVGYVYEVGYSYAKVRTIIDSRSAAACLLQRTRDNGVLRGVTTEAYTTASCYVYYLPTTSDAAVGDVVITSGTDSLYPKGIPVGTISAISRNSDTSDNYVVVTPYVDFQHIEEVLVLRTIVEKDTDEQYTPLYTPTPRPTKEASDISLPTVEPEPTSTVESDDDPWFYPTAAPTAPADPSNMGDMEGQWSEGVLQ